MIVDTTLKLTELVSYMDHPVRLFPGNTVVIQSFEGFGGPAEIVDYRESETSNYKVMMLDGSQPDAFWAFNFEIYVWTMK